LDKSERPRRQTKIHTTQKLVTVLTNTHTTQKLVTVLTNTHTTQKLVTVLTNTHTTQKRVTNIFMFKHSMGINFMSRGFNLCLDVTGYSKHGIYRSWN
jgi:hypothetical protein